LVSLVPGKGQNLNQDNFAAASGRPEGRGAAAGSTRVVSLGTWGSSVSEFATPALREIVVFGNEFETNGRVLQPEPAMVEVSPQGSETPDANKEWYKLSGNAGAAPTYVNSSNMMD